MKIYRNGEYVKNIPAKFKPISEEFNPESSGKRLTKIERRWLEVRLTRIKLKEWLDSQPKSHQIDFAINSANSNQIRDAVTVNKRGGDVQYRFTFFDGVTIRVPYSVFKEYPKAFWEVKNEF